MPNFRPLSETKFINDANLVSYWKLDETSGATATDVKGTSNGTMSGTYAWQTGVFGNSINLSSGAFFKSTVSTGLSGSFTISGWVKFSDSGSLQYPFCSHVTSYDNYWMIVNRETNNKIRFNLYDGTNNPYTDSIVTVGDSSWAFITAVRDTTADKIKLYINGAFQSETTDTTTSVPSYSNFGIGQDRNSTDRYFVGNIDEMAIFSRALSSAEVNELYQGMTLGEYLGAGSATTKLLLHLNGNSTDSSGNGNNGTDSNITYVDGKFGKCASFNGSTSVIQTPFTGMTTGTISVWYKGSASDDALFVVNKNSDNSNNYLQFVIGGVSAGDIYVFSLSSIELKTSGGIVSADIWTNIVFTQTGSLLTIYKDGKIVTSTSSSFWFNSVSSANQYCIGALKRGSQIYSKTTGSIDEVIVENRAWTAEEVKKYYTNAKGFYATL